MNDDVDMDDYLVILEKELKVFTDKIRDESQGKISKILTDLESGKQGLLFLYLTFCYSSAATRLPSL